MVKHVGPDQILVQMPSLRAVRSFIAAAKYQNFTRAAEALCVTQAAVSRQIRELEESLGVPLFKRAGRAVELTEAGSILYDAVSLSFINIAQAAQRITEGSRKQQELTICCSPAFAALWLANHLPEFFSRYPHIDINVVSTNNFLTLEPGVYPDVFINKVSDPRDGYHSVPLFYDLIYPVCSPDYLDRHPEIESLEELADAALLELSPYGRSQVAEHVDWSTWFSFHGIDLDRRKQQEHSFSSNDYNLLITMTMRGQGVCLGYHHLIAPLLETGALVRPCGPDAAFREKLHYLSYSESNRENQALDTFYEWFMARIDKEETRVTS